MTPDELKPCREAFEKWALDKDTENDCLGYTTNAAFEIWQAAYESAKPNGDGELVKQLEYWTMELDHLGHVSGAAIHESPLGYFDRVYKLAKEIFSALKSTPPQTNPAIPSEATVIINKNLNLALGYADAIKEASNGQSGELAARIVNHLEAVLAAISGDKII